MRISLLTMELLVNGGAQRQLLVLGKWLQAFGHDVTVYAYRYNPAECYSDLAAGLDIRCVERVASNGTHRRADAPARRLLRGAQRHMYESWKLAQLIDHPGDLLNPHARGATRAAVECKRRTGVPVVWMCDDARNWEQAGYRPQFSSPVQWVCDQVMRCTERAVVREIDCIVALDHRVKSILERCYGRPTEVVRSGLDAQAFRERPEARRAIRSRHGIPQDAFLLLWLGILEPHRHLEDALEAIRLLHRQQEQKDVRLLIVGSDAFAPRYARKLEEMVAQHSLESVVRFVFRSVPENEMPDYYSACDALVYLCENQSWGLAVFEAMACRRPVIVSRACGAHEVLADRETALLVPPRDPGALARAVNELADSPEFSERIARQGRAYVIEQLSWEKYARSMQAVFEQVRHEGDGDRAGHRGLFA